MKFGQFGKARRASVSSSRNDCGARCADPSLDGEPHHPSSVVKRRYDILLANTAAVDVFARDLPSR
jgi:hypothetical protein